MIKKDLIEDIKSYFKNEVEEDRDLDDLLAQVEEADELLAWALEFLQSDEDIIN